MNIDKEISLIAVLLDHIMKEKGNFIQTYKQLEEQDGLHSVNQKHLEDLSIKQLMDRNNSIIDKFNKYKNLQDGYSVVDEPSTKDIEAYSEMLAEGFDPFINTQISTQDLYLILNLKEIIGWLLPNDSLKHNILLSQSEEGKKHLDIIKWKETKAKAALLTGEGGVFTRTIKKNRKMK
jgi:hypothetical protein